MNFSMDVLYFELAEVPGYEDETQPLMRLCLALEKRFPNIRWWQQIQYLCDIATEDDNCLFACRDTWIKTTVTLKNADSIFREPLSKVALRERIRRPNVPGLDNHSAEPQIAIRQNVLPLEFYRRRQSTRNFHMRGILDNSHREGKPLQKMCRAHCCNNIVPAALESASMTESSETAAGVVGLRNLRTSDIMRVKKFASGKDGTVWKVVWRNCTYALKSYYFKAMFDIDHEIATMRPVSQHPHIVRAFAHSRWYLEDDVSDEEQPYCLLMELLDGDLRRLWYEAVRSKPLSRLEKLDVLLQMASGMERLHENQVVHGDLKPDNILVEESGHVREIVAKVGDFGSAKIIDSSSNFVPSEGSTLYASPEVLMTRSAVMKKLVANGRAMPMLDVPANLDVYSFGVMAYEILTDSVAFAGQLTTSEHLYRVAAGDTRLIHSENWKTVNFGYNEVVPLVERCLEWDSKARPPFCEVCATLRRARSELQASEVTASKLRVAAILLFLLVVYMFLSYIMEFDLKALVNILVRLSKLIVIRACAAFPARWYGGEWAGLKWNSYCNGTG